MMPDIIAIDGPAASGKSSVSRLLARTLRLHYVNSGAFYRSLTSAVNDAHIDARDPAVLTDFISSLDLQCGTGADGHPTLSINGHITTEAALRDPAVNAGVSIVASNSTVRDRLTHLLRSLATGGPLVMEGRDIGSVVFPDTRCKFYIDANEEVRARRRAAQGETDSIARRDALDSTRKNAPLIIAEDAHVIDSSHLTLEGVVGEIIGRLRLKGFTVSL